ncbi:MAG: type II CAAX endopeptidase family protein [Microthrixaceae bacterium]
MQIDDHRLLVGTLLGMGAWNLIGNLLLPGVWYIPANVTVSVCLIGASRRAGFSWDDLGLSITKVTAGLRLGIAAGLAILIALASVLVVPQAASTLGGDGVASSSSFDHWFRPLIRIPLGTVLMEEVLFRGVLLAILLRRHSVRVAVTVSALFFGLWHIVPALETSNGSAAAVVGATIGTVVATSIAGIGFAYLRLRSQSLVAPMLAHWCTNGIAYGVVLIALRST